MTQQEKQSLLNEQYLIVNNAEAQLKATDYIAAKIAEGKATKTEYKDSIEQRQQWRDQINAAQEEIARLEAVETDDDAPLLDE
jgi:hypothetical protein